MVHLMVDLMVDWIVLFMMDLMANLMVHLHLMVDRWKALFVSTPKLQIFEQFLA